MNKGDLIFYLGVGMIYYFRAWMWVIRKEQDVGWELVYFFLMILLGLWIIPLWLPMVIAVAFSRSWRMKVKEKH